MTDRGAAAYNRTVAISQLADREFFKNINKKFENKLYKYTARFESKVIESKSKVALRYINTRRKIGGLAGPALVKPLGRLVTEESEKAELLAETFAHVCVKHSAFENENLELYGSFPQMADSVAP